LSALARAALEKAVLLDTFPKAVVDVYACVLEAGDSRLQAQASVRA
jgi:ribonuclease PH